MLNDHQLNEAYMTKVLAGNKLGVDAPCCNMPSWVVAHVAVAAMFMIHARLRVCSPPLPNALLLDVK